MLTISINPLRYRPKWKWLYVSASLAFRLPRLLSLFNFTHLWFVFGDERAGTGFHVEYTPHPALKFCFNSFKKYW